MTNKQFKIVMLFSVIFLFIGDVFYGQDTLKTKEKIFLIKSNLGLIWGDYITESRGIPIGFEIKINKKLSFNLDFSYLLKGRYGCCLRYTTEKLRGIRTDYEIKRYLKDKDLRGFYLSAHVLYQYTEGVVWYPQTTYRNLFAFHEKIGWQLIDNDGFVLDFAIGVGTRYEYSKTSSIYQLHVFNEFNLLHPFYPYNKIYQYGSKWFFSITGSFRIGWAF